MIVRELITLLGFKTDPKSEEKAKSSLDTMKKAAAVVAGVFAAIRVAQGFGRLIDETVALGDQIGKTSAKLGIGVEALQELRFAAEQTGVATKSLDVGIQRFTRRAAEAAKGGGSAKDALKELGVQLKDANGNLRPTEELLNDVADGLAATESQSERVRLSFKLFDTEGVALVNTLGKGSAALMDLRKRARELGGVLDADLIRLSEEYTDVNNEMSKTVQGLSNDITGELLPGWIEWKRQIREVIADVRGPLLSGLRFAVRILGALAKPLPALAIALSGVALAFSKLGLTATVAWVKVAAPAILAAGLIAAIGAAIVLVIDDLEAMGEGGDSVIGGLISEFQLLLAETDSVFGAIGKIISTAVEFWSDQLLNVFGSSLGEIRDDLDSLLSVFGLTAAGVSGAVGEATKLGAKTALLGPLAFLPGIGTSLPGGNSSSTEANVAVTVNAPGAADPQAIGRAAASGSRSGTSSALRAARDQLSVGVGTRGRGAF